MSMKKSVYLLSFLFSGILVTTAIFSCEEDTNEDETCQKDEICEAKYATVCCTDDGCVYKIDGKEYTDIDDAEIALGCSVGMVKSAGGDNDVVTRLKDLMRRVQEQHKSNK